LRPSALLGRLSEVVEEFQEVRTLRSERQEDITQLSLEKGENPIYFSPADSFDFSTDDNAFYGYVKVVDDLNNVDVEAIKAEVTAFETLIYPADYFTSAGSGASCH
jgi:hypothetical protein